MSAETQSASVAVQILCKQFVDRIAADQEQLAQIAFQTDKLNPAEGWRFDAFKAEFVKTSTGPALVPDAAPPE